MLIVVVSIVLFGSYAGLRFSQLPLVADTCPYSLLPINSTASILINGGDPAFYQSPLCSVVSTSLTITVSFPIYVIALASFLGWWLLILFLGAGLSALPVDLINEFRFRPIPMKEDEFQRSKIELANQVDKLL